MDKKVSIIIPTYKRPIQLGRAIDSALNQTYNNIEIIVVDDNSEGDENRANTQLFMKRYEANTKIKYIKHKVNQNGAAARNTGLKNADGEFIAFLDDDDYYLPDKIEKQLSLLNDLDESWGGVTCFHVRKYKDCIYKFEKINIKGDGNYCAEFLSGQTSMPSTTLLLKRNVFEVIGYFDEKFYRHQDLEFLVRFFRCFKMDVCAEILMVMQVDGFRNFPSGEKSLQIKKQFIEKFQIDFEQYPKDIYNSIMHYQWLPVAGFLIRERKMRQGYNLLKSQVFPRSSALIIDIMTICYYQLTGLIPGFTNLHAYIMGNVFYKKLNRTIKTKFNEH